MAAMTVAEAQAQLDAAKERALEAGRDEHKRRSRRKLVAGFERWFERSGGTLDSRFRHLDGELCRLDADAMKPRLDELDARIDKAKAAYDWAEAKRLEPERAYLASWRHYVLAGRPEVPERVSA